jgi:hypothetical protein
MWVRMGFKPRAHAGRSFQLCPAISAVTSCGCDDIATWLEAPPEFEAGPFPIVTAESPQLIA